MNHKLEFRPGTRFLWDGKPYTVIAIKGGCFEARGIDGVSSLIDIAGLLNEPGFSFVDWDYEDTRIEPIPDGSAPSHAVKAAKELERHLLEAMTGSPEGHLEVQETPIQDQYDPATSTLTERMKRKARELEIAENAMWVYRRNYLAHGLFGLIDKRSNVIRHSKGRLDARIEEVIAEVLKTRASKSDVKLAVVRAEVNMAVKDKYGTEVKLPSVPTLNRHIGRMKMELKFKGPASQRLSQLKQPSTPYRWFQANRPGQTVLIDSTLLDVFALEPITGQWIRLQLTIAIDLFTRSLVAWRFTTAMKGIDAALLLYDIVRPKQFLSGWPDQARWNYVGVPESLVVHLYQEPKSTGDGEIQAAKPLAGILAVYPETVVIDHGKVYVSDTFKRSCLLLGINIQMARLYTPTDKSPVETTFDFIKDNFCALLRGFIGPNVLSRGEDVEKDAIYFVNDIEEMFADWVANFWQRRVHAGLQLDGAPHVEVSPNDAYAEGLSRAGFVHCVPNDGIYFSSLPFRALAVNHDGVNLFGIRYDDVELEPFRQRPAPTEYGERGRYLIRYDPRMLSQCYFYDFHNHKWLHLNWRRAAPNLAQPFNDLTLAYARSVAIQRYGEKPTAQMVEDALEQLLRRFQSRIYTNESERRLLIKQTLQAQSAAKDLKKLGREKSENMLPTTRLEFDDDDTLDLEVTPDIDDQSDASLVEEYVSPYDF